MMVSLLGCQGVGIDYPEATGYVNDYANVMSRQGKTNLESLLLQLDEQTGIQIAIALLESINGVDSRDYTTRLFEKWQVGSKNDEGVLIVLITGENTIEVEVGYGLEHVLTDARVGSMLDSYFLPHFKANELEEGIINGVNALVAHLAQHKGADLDTNFRRPPRHSDESTFELPGYLIFIIVIAGVGISLFASIFANRCPRCKKKITVRNTVIQHPSMLSNGYGIKYKNCNHCGYKSEKRYVIPRRMNHTTRGGFGGGGSKGGFGGFGGGRSGGAGAGRKW